MFEHLENGKLEHRPTEGNQDACGNLTPLKQNYRSERLESNCLIVPSSTKNKTSPPIVSLSGSHRKFTSARPAHMQHRVKVSSAISLRDIPPLLPFRNKCFVCDWLCLSFASLFPSKISLPPSPTQPRRLARTHRHGITAANALEHLCD